MYRVFFASLPLAICLAAPMAAAPTTFGSEDAVQSAGMASDLAVCIGKYKAGRGYESYVPELTASSAAASASLLQLFSAMQVADTSPYLKKISEVESAYGQELLADPMSIRAKLRSLKIECDRNTQQAIAFHQALERRDAQAEAAKVAEQQAMKKAEQARLAAEKIAKDSEEKQQRILAEAQKAQEADAGLTPPSASPTIEPAASSPAPNVAQNPVDAQETGPFKINGKIPAIKDIALGAGPEACPTKIEKVTYLNILKRPDRFAYTCEIVKENDKTMVFFDSAGQHVVRVYRRLGVDTRKIDFRDLWQRAVENYGSPTIRAGDDVVGYGNMFEISRNGDSLNEKEAGKGLRIESKYCGVTGCSDFDDDTLLIELDLQDAGAYNQSVADGKSEYEGSTKTAAKSVNF